MRLLIAIVLAFGAAAGHADERLQPALDAYARGQFDSARTAFERVFALWHVAHLPFVYLLVISAVVHVVAVHAY